MSGVVAPVRISAPTLELLLDAGCSVAAVSNDGASSINFRIKGFKQLAAKGGPGVWANRREKPGPRKPGLIGAAARGDVALVRRLVARGAELEERSKDGLTAFLGACHNGEQECAELGGTAVLYMCKSYSRMITVIDYSTLVAVIENYSCMPMVTMHGHLKEALHPTLHSIQY